MKGTANDGASRDLSGTHMLIVEDDPQVSDALDHYFTLQGCTVAHAFDGEQALEQIAGKQSFDIVLLDVALPRLGGFEVLKETQRLGIHTPILMVTAKGDREHILQAFGLGAQDYVVKPFDADDLMQRVRAILTPYDGSERPTSVQIGDVRIDLLTGEAHRGARSLRFEELELELLRSLISSRGRVVTRRRLLLDAWGIDADASLFSISPDVVARTVDRHIDAIRGKIEPDPHFPRYLESVYGLGYRLRAS